MRKTLSFAIEEAKVYVPALQNTVIADNTDTNGVNRRGLGEFDNMLRQTSALHEQRISPTRLRTFHLKKPVRKSDRLFCVSKKER